jgi:hypothetical protein
MSMSLVVVVYAAVKVITSRSSISIKLKRLLRVIVLETIATTPTSKKIKFYLDIRRLLGESVGHCSKQ